MFGFIKSLFGASTAASAGLFDTPSSPGINPATGLPMIDAGGGVDVGGNPFGTDLFSDASSRLDLGSFDWSSDSGSSFDSFDSFDSFGSFGSSWD